MRRRKLPFNLILLGMVASGKDTQALLLTKRYIFKTVESGNYWRSLLTANSKEGRAMRRTIAKGFPAPIPLMKAFLKKQLKEKPRGTPLLFLGNPRLLPEAKLLLSLLKRQHESCYALYISLPDREVYRRTNARNRHDDYAVVKRRVEWHKSKVGETVEYLESLGKLKRINGNRPVDEVTRSIEKAITEFATQEFDTIAK